MKKKIFVLCLALTMVLGLCLTGCGGGEKLTLNVYNWGEYISDGSEDSFDTIAEFETWYEDSRVTELDEEESARMAMDF